MWHYPSASGEWLPASRHRKRRLSRKRIDERGKVELYQRQNAYTESVEGVRTHEKVWD